MSLPIILITTGRQNHYTQYREVQSVSFGCDINYLNSVIRSGGMPLMLPCVMEPEAVTAVLQVADGVLFSGGGDILSLAYGEEPHEQSKYQDSKRDAAEIALARQALAMKLPIFGICRGQQLLNVALGGTLYQDISTQVPDAIKHVSEGLDVLLQHTITIEEDSLLARVFGTTTMAVNSWHHQAVKTLGNGLRISARAHDGVVEALESTDGTPLLTLQCHPEECTGAYPVFQRVFDWLVTEARAYRERKAVPV